MARQKHGDGITWEARLRQTVRSTKPGSHRHTGRDTGLSQRFRNVSNDHGEPRYQPSQSARASTPPRGEGKTDAEANKVIVKITGADTDQTFEVVEENCKLGFQSRAHYHINAYETFYVFDGSADFQVGFYATKGSCVHIPPGVPHQVTAPNGLHMLKIYSPAGTESIFADMHALSQEQLMNAELTRKLALKHDTVIIEQSTDGCGKGTILG